MFSVDSIDWLPEYIETSIKKSIESPDFTITIYHVIIGSYAYDTNINNPDLQLKRNHEFPQIVKNLFYNPEIQFSPEMKEYISHYDNIIIRQVLLLIDPMYINNVPMGLLNEIFVNNDNDNNNNTSSTSNTDISTGSNDCNCNSNTDVIDVTDDKYIINKEIQYNEFKKIKIQSTIEPVIVPFSVNEKQIIELTDIITQYCVQYCAMPLLVNIIDCTSITLRNMHIYNTNPYVYIATPKCFLIDEEIQYLPIITKQIDENFRWCTYNSDLKYMADYKSVKDICKNANITYTFLINIFKRQKMEIDLLTIYKFLGIITINIDYTLVNGIIFQFNNITFQDFIKLWQQKDFQYIYLSMFDPYYKDNITIYTNFLTSNIDILARINDSTSIKNVLFQEAFNVFTQLHEYFPDDKLIHLPANASLINRFEINEYIVDI
jgi:hypothetical protein